MTNVQCGDIWLVDLDPTRGQGIQKTRPAVIISSNTLGAIASGLIEATE